MHVQWHRYLLADCDQLPAAERLIEGAPLTILGSSEGLRGSTAILTTACVWNCSGRKMCTSSSRNSGTMVAVLLMVASKPSNRTQLPAKTHQDERFSSNEGPIRHTVPTKESQFSLVIPSVCRG